MTQFEKLDLLLRECGGTIQTFQVLNNGISKSVFYAYVKERGLEQASHGVLLMPLSEKLQRSQVLSPSAHRSW